MPDGVTGCILCGSRDTARKGAGAMESNVGQVRDPWHMAGTEGTGEYVVVARTPLGCVGYREFGHVYRVRVEPQPSGWAALARALTKDSGWKQPGDGGQARFSIEVGGDRLRAILGAAVRAIRPRDF